MQSPSCGVPFSLRFGSDIFLLQLRPLFKEGETGHATCLICVACQVAAEKNFEKSCGAANGTSPPESELRPATSGGLKAISDPNWEDPAKSLPENPLLYCVSLFFYREKKKNVASTCSLLNLVARKFVATGAGAGAGALGLGRGWGWGWGLGWGWVEVLLGRARAGGAGVGGWGWGWAAGGAWLGPDFLKLREFCDWKLI